MSAARLERLRELRELRQQKRDARYAVYGTRVGPNTYETVEDGVTVSSLVAEGETGTVVYQIVGVSAADLM